MDPQQLYPRLTVTDVLVAAWVALWIVIGVLVGIEVHQLGQYGDTLSHSATALDSASDGLRIVDDIPFVGGKAGRIADDIETTAADLRRSADNTRNAAYRLTYLLAFAVMVTPTVPLLVVYLPARLRSLRDRRALLRAVAAGHGAFAEKYLANRALADLPVDVLAQLSADPWREVRQGNTEPFINVELQRLRMEREIERRKGA